MGAHHKVGQKVGKAGPSPLRASIGDQLAARQNEIITAPQEAQEDIVTKPGEVVDPAAKAELEQAPTQAMPSSNPPPPNTADFIAASQPPAKPPRQVDSQVMTGDVPIVVEEPQSATPPGATGPIAPNPPVAALAPPSQTKEPVKVKTFFGHQPLPSAAPAAPPRTQHPVQMMTLSSFTPFGRFRKGVAAAWNSIRQNKGYAALILMAGTTVAIGIALLVANVIAPRFVADATSSESTVSETVPTAPPETVTVSDPVAPVVAPEPAPVAEPGFGGRARAIAREAFPTSCLTAGAIAHSHAIFLCGPGQRDGTNLCNCTVVPRRR
jgi:hypothetical protein